MTIWEGEINKTAIKWKKRISLLLARMVLSGSALADGLQIVLEPEIKTMTVTNK